MDAALQINPYYGKTSMSGLAEHFKYVLRQATAWKPFLALAWLGRHPLRPRAPAAGLLGKWKLRWHSICIFAGRCWRRGLLSSTMFRAEQVHRAHADDACLRHCQLIPTRRAPAATRICLLAGQDIPNDVMLALAAHDNFLGVKECSGADPCHTHVAHYVLLSDEQGCL